MRSSLRFLALTGSLASIGALAGAQTQTLPSGFDTVECSGCASRDPVLLTLSDTIRTIIG